MDCSRTCSCAIPPQTENPSTRRDQQLPSCHLQLYYHVLLPDLVPDCNVDFSLNRRWGLINFLRCHHLRSFRITSFAEQCLNVPRFRLCGVRLLSPRVLVKLIFRSWVMHRTGKYKMLNTVFGFFPFVAAVLIATLNQNSSDARLWLSIVSVIDTTKLPP